MLHLDPAMKERWDSRVFHVYQAQGFTLRGTVLPPVDIDAKKFYWLKSGTGEATEYTVGDEVQDSNLDVTRIEVQAKEWDFGGRIYDWNRSRISYREEDQLVQNAAMALGRQADRVIYDKFKATDFNALGQVVGDFVSAWDPAKALQACDKLQSKDVPWDGNVFCGLPSKAWNQMLTYQVFSNSQWTGPDLPFTKVTDRRSWNGVHWFMLPNHLRKLPNATDLTFYMWHQTSTGCGNNEGGNIRTEWERETKKKAWWYQSTIDGACEILQTSGIVECRMKADSAIALTAGL